MLTYLSSLVTHYYVDGDQQWDQTDPTFHQYDTFNPICTIGDKNCTMDVLNETLEKFSYPAEGMKPVPVDFSGISMAYVIRPFIDDVEDPSDYTMELGPIKQVRLYSGGIQNQTQEGHKMDNAVCQSSCLIFHAHFFSGFRETESIISQSLTSPLQRFGFLLFAFL